MNPVESQGLTARISEPNGLLLHLERFDEPGSTMKMDSDVAVNGKVAELRTAAVTITTLRIGDRQVTKAIFNQIISESIIDPDDGNQKGTAWGRVLLDGDWHLVWQKGSELRRCELPRSVDDEPWSDGTYELRYETSSSRSTKFPNAWRAVIERKWDHLFIAA